MPGLLSYILCLYRKKTENNHRLNLVPIRTCFHFLPIYVATVRIAYSRVSDSSTRKYGTTLYNEFSVQINLYISEVCVERLKSETESQAAERQAPLKVQAYMPA